MTATQAEPRSAPALRRRRFTRADYHAMGRAGILDHRERLELIDGAIYVMSPIGRRHAACVDWINAAFFESGGLAGRALVRVQNPMAESEHSEPQPDLMLLAERSDRYADGHPAPEEVLLLVEVADSTLAFDRRTKIPLYAADGVREVKVAGLGPKPARQRDQHGGGRSQQGSPVSGHHPESPCVRPSQV